MPKLTKKIFFLVFLSVFSFTVCAQVLRIEPPTWWAGMSSNFLQLMIHGKNISNLEVSISYPGVTIASIHRPANENYLFIDLEISPEARPGVFDIYFKKAGNTIDKYSYTLQEREAGSAKRVGFNNSDVIYLVMPDRFANGNLANDNIEGMPDKINRQDPYGRRGGDLKGLIDNLNYIKDMGFTAIWLNPVLENNQFQQSYHGYATTDFYMIDPRIGTNEEYRKFSRLAAEKGIKIIKDLILNHCGSEHWWMKDMPFPDWINFYPEMIMTNHRRTTIQDPNASEADRKLMTDGWFVPQMPDLNQRNPFMANYLIQKSIWWIEFAGLTGIRVDTYPYPDKYFMARLNKRLLEEYPGLNIVGEEWSPNPAIVSYWQKGQVNRDGYESNLPSLMDFPLQFALRQSMLEKEGWEQGLNRLYYSLANDFLYPNPFNLVIFADNHDMSRFFVQVNEDINLYKLGIAFILTTRGIPQIYYGSEILMTHLKTDGHGNIRKEFPGGWADHKTNAFTGKGLTKNQANMQDYFRKLLNWRKNSPQIHTGRLTHFAPVDGVYVYFRSLNEKITMMILNKNTNPYNLSLARFREVLKNKSSGYEIISGMEIDLSNEILVPALTPLIIDIR